VCGSGETRWLCPVKALDEQSGISKSSGGVNAGSLGKRIFGGGFSGKVKANNQAFAPLRLGVKNDPFTGIAFKRNHGNSETGRRVVV
jgi:hypothetical protein